MATYQPPTENINQFSETIEEKKTEISELKKLKDQNTSCMQRFFDMRIKKFYYRICWKHLMINRKAGKEKKRIRYYYRNALYRKKLLRLFKNW